MTRSHRTWQLSSLALAGLLVGCTDLGDAETGGDSTTQSNALELQNGLARINGLSSANGLTAANGLCAANGLSSANGLSVANGLSSANGLASANGLMTTTMGRRTVQYIASCALSSSQTLSKNDQYGTPHSYPGSIGLATNWLSGSISAADEANVSACLMARINSAGMHVPLWMDAAPSSIGWGQSSTYPVQEGAYFGDVMRAASDGTVHAWFCNGRDWTKAVVPGRLGADKTSGIYTNPFGQDALCDNFCTKYGTDGYTACNGVTNPITVWRQSSYNPVFDDNYVYRLVSVSSGLTMDVYGWGSAENTQIDQYPDTGGANQHFRIILVASSQWKIIDMNSGKAVTNRNGSSAPVQLNSYINQDSDNWSIDDHNGHFIIKNKSTKAYLHSSGTGSLAVIDVTTNYNGAADTDWDLYAIDSL
jgi:hypothetical protein